MLSKCLNPACGTPFRYLREGRIFRLQIPTAAGSGRREYFWLCGQCCGTLTVVVKDGIAAVQPRSLELPGGTAGKQEEAPCVP